MSKQKLLKALRNDITRNFDKACVAMAKSAQEKNREQLMYWDGYSDALSLAGSAVDMILKTQLREDKNPLVLSPTIKGNKKAK
jgi:hypothetical protein